MDAGSATQLQSRASSRAALTAESAAADIWRSTAMTLTALAWVLAACVQVGVAVRYSATGGDKMALVSITLLLSALPAFPEVVVHTSFFELEASIPQGPMCKR